MSQIKGEMIVDVMSDRKPYRRKLAPLSLGEEDEGDADPSIEIDDDHGLP